MSDVSRFGLSCALVTPFAPDGAVEVARLAAHARDGLARGCASVTLFGTTGEGASLGLGEREAALGALLAAGVAPGAIVGGLAAAAVEDAAAQGRMLAEASVRALLVPPPFYFKGVPEDGVFAWYAALFARLGGSARDVLLYNIPSVTQVALSPGLVGRLRRDFPEVILGVKDSSGDWPGTQALLAEHRDLAILVGDERHLARGVRLGAQGAISGLANVMPEMLLPLAREGTEDPRVGAVVDLVLAHPVTPAVKALVAHRTGEAAWRRVRPPLAALDAEAAAALGRDVARATAGPAA
jgi:4-hydroxy-tetrahydrodipicolinate synthase